MLEKITLENYHCVFALDASGDVWGYHYESKNVPQSDMIAVSMLVPLVRDNEDVCKVVRLKPEGIRVLWEREGTNIKHDGISFDIITAESHHAIFLFNGSGELESVLSSSRARFIKEECDYDSAVETAASYGWFHKMLYLNSDGSTEVLWERELQSEGLWAYFLSLAHSRLSRIMGAIWA